MRIDSPLQNGITCAYRCPRGAGDQILDVLDSEGVNEIDSMVLTHNHTDHIGSADAIINEVSVGEVYHSGINNDATS